MLQRKRQEKKNKRLTLLAKNKSYPIAEDTTHLGHTTWMTQAGSKPEILLPAI